MQEHPRCVLFICTLPGFTNMPKQGVSPQPGRKEENFEQKEGRASTEAKEAGANDLF